MKKKNEKIDKIYFESAKRVKINNKSKHLH